MSKTQFHGSIIAVAAIATFWSVPASGFSESGPIIKFDAPGAGTGAGQGTFAININSFGVAVGYFVDDNTVYHGFVRSPFGHLKTIDAPGAGAVPGSAQGTIVESINDEGTIAGQYQDANYVYHCFLRYLDGRIITFDAPGAGTGPNQGSLAVDINVEGTIAGFTLDENEVEHGFVRSRWGAFTSFDAPDAGTGPFEGTMVTLESGLNPKGETIGWSIVTSNMAHGFVREPNGAITLFDPPGSVYTIPGSINPSGLIVGGAADKNGVLHGFVRRVDGAIATFDVPGAALGTLALGVTPFGLSTGYWIDSNRLVHGFLRYPNGAILKFDAPGAGAVPGVIPPQGTVPQGMNFWGEIVGFVVDTNNAAHGFIRIP
jgi:hypothetical protein